jgi:hypothetical protein
MTRGRLTFEFLDELLEQRLLHILHASWLNSNDARSLLRLRYKNDPNRPLFARLQESDKVLLAVITVRRDGIIDKRKYFL